MRFHFRFTFGGIFSGSVENPYRSYRLSEMLETLYPQRNKDHGKRKGERR